jgi:hypothetical protein
MSQTYKNCCTGGDAGDLTQSIVNAAESLKDNAAKLNTFTNGNESATVNLGGVTTKSVRGLVKSFTDPMTGYVNQAANSASQANAHKNAAAASATQAANSAAKADENAGAAVLAAASARVSASDSAISASKAKWHADKLEGVDGTLAEHRLAIDWNAQRITDLSWTPWGIALTAVRETRSAIVQAMDDYRAYKQAQKNTQAITQNAQAITQNAHDIALGVQHLESVDGILASHELSIAWNAQHIEDGEWEPWGIAISACRNTASAIRQAMELANLYRLVKVLTAGGGGGSDSGLAFVPD